ncbi:transcriptional regulator [Kaistia sp. 32K]|uniref:LysR substrate-binding domain-containing protein n=1 Tax=Kaistia sp. 32K TaxID=2795690 RepID=UPI001915BC4A|nr:LysR substrate-binding domain-containing protein [Kaistia sp. 32K]BCP52883.1 transcriptional regulator [Kaistia sp. 32K]
MADPFKVPLNALRAIEIVARSGTLAIAADELGVTSGAVSQHIRRAEARLGVLLFERTPRGLVPTPALEAALPLLSAGFRQVAEAVSVMEGDRRGTLTITTAPTFAARWLVQRLGRFTRENPDIEIRFVASTTVVDLARSDVDCAIRLGRGDWPGVAAEKLLPQPFFPVCAPLWRDPLREPADLGHVPVVADEGTMVEWAAWFEAAGAPMPKLAGPSFTDPILALEATISGQGVMLAWQMVVQDALDTGRLVRPFATEAKTDLAYWFVTTEAKRKNRKVRLFHDWLTREMALSTGIAPGSG